LVGELLTKFEKELEWVKVNPSSGGRFEIVLDGELIYSKLQTHRHAEPGEVAKVIEQKLKRS